MQKKGETGGDCGNVPAVDQLSNAVVVSSLFRNRSESGEVELGLEGDTRSSLVGSEKNTRQVVSSDHLQKKRFFKPVRTVIFFKCSWSLGSFSLMFLRVLRESLDML